MNKRVKADVQMVKAEYLNVIIFLYYLLHKLMLYSIIK